VLAEILGGGKNIPVPVRMGDTFTRNYGMKHYARTRTRTYSWNI